MVLCDLLWISNGIKHFIRIRVVLGLGLSPENTTQSLQALVRAISTLPESNRKDYRLFIFQNNGSFQPALQVQLSIIAKYNRTEVCIIQNFWKTWFKLSDPNHTEGYVNCERSACSFTLIHQLSLLPASLSLEMWKRMIDKLQVYSGTFWSLIYFLISEWYEVQGK